MSFTGPAISVMNKFYKKLSLFGLGASLSESFCRNNNIPVPEYRLQRLDSTGLYLPQTRTRKAQVLVDLEKTANPVENPGHMRWSHPGWKTDRTAFGVVLHETGHHVDRVIMEHVTKTKPIRQDVHGAYASDRDEWFEAHSGKRVSGYEPNASEAFAETMRLFIGNPDLLRRAIPSRYNYLCQVLRLQAVVPLDYKTAIGNSKYYPAAEKWIGVNK